MDPALWELLQARADGGGEEVEAIIRLDRPRVPLTGVRVVSRFGPIATCRLTKDSVVETHEHENVLSLKAARVVGPEQVPPGRSSQWLAPTTAQTDVRRPAGLTGTGAGVVVGFVDWGCDFGHANFRHADGSTRLLALWDQRGSRSAGSPHPFGYGMLHRRRHINHALRSADPYRALGYHPADADQAGVGAHGTHVMDIAIGNGRAGGPIGIAPQALPIFVHLADRGTGGLANLGDSVRILEAIDFIARTARDRPWVINLSVGRMGGPHDGSSLAEQALDWLLAAAPNRFVVQSAGNYFARSTHASGRLTPGSMTSLRFDTDQHDLSPNELELWYSGADEISVEVESPTGQCSPDVPLGGQAPVLVAGRLVGRLYNRRRDPNNGDNQVELFLYPWAPFGRWTVTLTATSISDGRFHAWLERDEACRNCQARFAATDVDQSCTTGTIANGHLPLVVGAYNAHASRRTLAAFSSAGPTRDGRIKPDLAAPGVAILAARSAPQGSRPSHGLLTRKDGTSMAAPHAAGVAALCLALRPFVAVDLRALLMTTAQPLPLGQDLERRAGAGYLDVAAAVRGASRVPGRTARPHRPPLARTTAYHEREPDMHDLEHDLLARVSPEQLYRETMYHQTEPSRVRLDRRFQVLARPGQRPVAAPAAGDVLVRVALGEPGFGCIAVLSDPALTPRGAFVSTGLVERGGPGLYATVLERGDASSHAQMARRILDPAGRMPPGQVLLRPRAVGVPMREPPTGPEDLSEEPSPQPNLGTSPSPGGDRRSAAGGATARWADTVDQVAFREMVLAAHIERSRSRKGAARPNLTPSQLRQVRGTTVCMATEAAAKAGELLDAANAAIAHGRRTGDPAIGPTSRITAWSGYRGREHQARTWRRLFSRYYDKTLAAREQLRDGPHSRAACQYMLDVYKIPDRIAAPGYSNHQAGVAIDFRQILEGADRIQNSTEPEAVARWRHTWFFKWLKDNAARFGFQPYRKEPWHWEYRPTGEPREHVELLEDDDTEEWLDEESTQPSPEPLDDGEGAALAPPYADWYGGDGVADDALGEFFIESSISLSTTDEGTESTDDYTDAPDLSTDDLQHDDVDGGLAEFAGSEHQAIGDAGSSRAMTAIAYGPRSTPLIFGEVVAMAGDYFGSYSELSELSKSGRGRDELAWARWRCLKLPATSEPRVDEALKKRVIDRYYALASQNVSHFSAGGTGAQHYMNWHAQAMDSALSAGRGSDEGAWRVAVGKEAFGDHFLTDMFSSGHVRMPRAAIRSWYLREIPDSTERFVRYMAKFLYDRLQATDRLPTIAELLWWITRREIAEKIGHLGGEALKSFSLGDIVSLALHDFDNRGLDVVSTVDATGRAVTGGYRWRAVGDSHLTGTGKTGADTQRMATAAVAISFRDLSRIRDAGKRLGTGQMAGPARADAIKRALAGKLFPALDYVPKEDPSSRANVPLARATGRSPLEWRWGQLGDVLYREIDRAVKDTIASELADKVSGVEDPADGPAGVKIHGIRPALGAFVKHLKDDGINVLHNAMGRPAR
jgi:subtilisin family serine protease